MAMATTMQVNGCHSRSDGLQAHPLRCRGLLSGQLRRTVPTQASADLGIGFVQNFSGEGLTSIGGGSDDMPNAGGATYNGNWVAAVQAADGDGNGPISLTNGDASLSAQTLTEWARSPRP